MPVGNDVWGYAAEAEKTTSANAAAEITRFIVNLSLMATGTLEVPAWSCCASYGVTVKGTSRVTD